MTLLKLNVASSYLTSSSILLAILALILFKTKNFISTYFRYLLTIKLYRLKSDYFHHGPVEKISLNIKGEDGNLATLVYLAKGEIKKPTIVIRTPYCKEVISIHLGRFRDQGFNVVIQDCRGRFESEGEFSYTKGEDKDTKATLIWISKQEWFEGNICMFGISYLGCIQWAALKGIDDAIRNGIEIPKPKCYVNIMSSSDLHRFLYSDNSFLLEMSLRYASIMHFIGGCGIFKERKRNMDLRTLAYMALKHWNSQDRKVKRAAKESSFPLMHKHLRIPPLPTFDPFASGEFWSQRRYSEYLDGAPPALLIGGWYDIFLRETLRDFAGLPQKDGVSINRNHLVVGPWTHFQSTEFDQMKNHLFLTIEFYKSTMCTNHEFDFPTVKLFVMESYPGGTWHSFSHFPPKESILTPFYLHGDKKLKVGEKVKGKVDRSILIDHVNAVPKNEDESLSSQVREDFYSQYVFDPVHFTPSLGGNRFHKSVGLMAGPVVNNELEKREDMLIFTTEPLDADFICVGYVSLIVYVKTSLGPKFDIFGRLCDVDEKGESLNVCDGLQRNNSLTHQIVEEDEESKVYEVKVDLWATGKLFKKNHRIRLQVASGNHPRWIRNYGIDKTGLDLIDVSLHEMKRNTIQILHDEDHGSALYLPQIIQLPPPENLI